MKAKIISKEEHDSWIKVLGKSYPIVLEQIVRANLTNPMNMGRALAAYELSMYSAEITVDDKQEETIDSESHTFTAYMIREMICFKYLFKWTIGIDLSDEERKSNEKNWKEFYANHKEEVDKYYFEVHNGYMSYVKEVHNLYPDLEHPSFN